MKYAVVTFGCRVNQADSLGFEEQFLARGGVAVAPADADVVVVNTCSVTASADQAARQTVRHIARRNPAAKIVVTGCYATRRPDEVQNLPNVLRVVPNDEKPKLAVLSSSAFSRGRESTLEAEVLERAGGAAFAPLALRRAWPKLEERRPGAPASGVIDAFVDEGEGSCGATIEPGVAGRTAFTLRVQTGCVEPCAYCIIPSTRGRPRSVPIVEVLAEVDRVTAAGFKEIALTGVHLGSYGRDLFPRSSLMELLRALADHISYARGAPPPLARAAPLEDSLCSRGPQALSRVTAPNRSVGLQPDVLFRISSLEPMDCTPDIVDLVATSDSFAPHFHLPLQHASNKVLAAMRRPYTIEHYASLVDGIRARLRHAAIGSDIIVGFPGETDDDVEELANYLETSPLTHLHVFPYSDRPGTVASRLGGRSHGSVVRERARRVREIGQRLTTAFRHSQVGTVHRALTLEDGSLVVTGNYLKVRIPPGRVRNEWVDVTITGTEPLAGRIGA